MPAQALASFHSDFAVNVHSVTKFRPFVVSKQNSSFSRLSRWEEKDRKKENRNRLSNFCGGAYVCTDMYEPPPLSKLGKHILTAQAHLHD